MSSSIYACLTDKKVPAEGNETVEHFPLGNSKKTGTGNKSPKKKTWPVWQYINDMLTGVKPILKMSIHTYIIGTYILHLPTICFFPCALAQYDIIKSVPRGAIIGICTEAN
jgi:hypothetical protein